MINQFLRDESGVTAVEYGLIAALVAVASIAGFQHLGQEMGAMYDRVAQVVADTIP
ncbi:Flp family type IVb pilin [Pelagibius sp. Alg239-R121]|uniref:Flp family type IVb pilin n=1 Tax=Pelagibius sp. Alg239-R121 TaxID=2993448 RepID=UPI0024A73710|nr:Flp family type IVb pilin [Pelagibius sp. Alg239-R121]